MLLIGEPASTLDPITTIRIEELVSELQSEFTIAIFTHNMQPAAPISNYTACNYRGELIRLGATDAMFLSPKDRPTEDYITGRLG
ncbi:hypothetical protein [Niveibacterium microcysteis]|uniref:Phosphate ABC transporter ATP-binding protein n=1 Tax=Niveibacterium microcysteis TaxID=2811415 RepID=A0ABX7M3Z5_9RHOO|nr:hypothetical protein [Niveibacterium microcysteis]QSI75631.1 hypothetical protein JY500_14150 [Niveibacterium microcysteis]